MKKNIEHHVVKKVVLGSLLAAAGLGTTLAQAREFGIVISSTPVLQQVAVPRQVCTTAQVQSQYRTGGGALIGAVVGGALGNQFGRGNGRTVSTVVGAIGGGLVGDQIEAQHYGSYPVTQNVQQCHTENTLENRTVAFNVLYKYAGQPYTVQMPGDQPVYAGSRIALRVSSGGYVMAHWPVAVQVAAQPMYVAPPVQTVTYQPRNHVNYANYPRPAPAVAAPVYGAYPRHDDRPHHRHHQEREQYRDEVWRDWR